MQYFKTGQANKVLVIASNGATPVTGKVAGDFTLYAAKNASSPAAITLAGLVTELDATNMPGVYVFTLPLAVFDTVGPLAMTVVCAGMDQYNVLGDVGLYDAVLDTKAMSGHVNFRITAPAFDGDRNMTSATLKGYNDAANALADTNARVEVDVTTTYDSNGNIATFLTEEQ